MTTLHRPTFTLRLVPASGRDAAPAHVRLRRLLKALLRGYGFRCVEVREEPAQVSNGEVPQATVGGNR